MQRSKFGGQFGQVFEVEKILNLTRNKAKKKRGFYVEAGACDGENLSNTLFLEISYGWTGLLVEPNPDFLPKLIGMNRHAWILTHCLSTTTRSQVVDFDAHLFNGGIINSLDPERSKPGDIGQNPNRPIPKVINKRTLKIQCFPLQAVLKAIGNPKIHYMSLDIEGAEFQVLQTLDWKNLDLKLLGVETVHAGEVFDGDANDIHDLMIDIGYIEHSLVGHDTFYLKPKA